jgi:hypothetical protein
MNLWKLRQGAFRAYVLFRTVPAGDCRGPSRLPDRRCPQVRSRRWSLAWKALVIGGWSRSWEIAAGAGGRLAGVRFPRRARLCAAGPPGGSSAAIDAAQKRM